MFHIRRRLKKQQDYRYVTTGNGALGFIAAAPYFNKSEFLRETLMKAILKRFDDEHPSLWEEPEPTLFNRQ